MLEMGLLFRWVGSMSQLAIPQTLQAWLAGHQAADKMLAQLTQWFYWPGIKAQVQRY